MCYLIDSDVLICFLKGHPEAVARLAALPESDRHTSRINVAELYCGAHHSSRVEENLRTFEAFLRRFSVFEFDQHASLVFAREKARLKKLGTPVADMDLMIASIAMANHCILVTNNLKHFKHIKGLKVEGLDASLTSGGDK